MAKKRNLFGASRRAASYAAALAAIAVSLAGCAGAGGTTGTESPFDSPTPLGATPNGSATGLSAPGASGIGSNAAFIEPPRAPAQDALASVADWSVDLGSAGEADAQSGALSQTSRDLVIVSPDPIAGGPAGEAAFVKSVHAQQIKRVFAQVDVATISTTGSLWSPAWTGGSPGALSASAPVWLIPGAAAQPDGGYIYKVDAVDPGWQKMLAQRICELAEAGFDGVYLSGCDQVMRPPGSHSNSADSVAALVETLDKSVHASTPSFGIIVSDNGTLASAMGKRERRRFLSGIDGALAQDVFTLSAVQTFTLPAAAKGDLDFYTHAGKPVFVTQTLGGADTAGGFSAAAKADGYLPSCAPQQSGNATATDPAVE